jgi:hypothetical protein
MTMTSNATSAALRKLLLRPHRLSAATSARGLSDDKASGQQQDKDSSLFARLLGPQSAVASPAFTNRWAMFGPAFATHVCLGAPYGWSAISAALSREYGMVVSSSADWMLDSCTYPMSIMVSDPSSEEDSSQKSYNL